MSDVQDAVRSGFEVLDIIIALQKKKKGEKKKNFMSLCAFMSASIIKRTSKQKKKKRKKTLTYTSLWKYSLSAFLLFLSVSITCENNLS